MHGVIQLKFAFWSKAHCIYTTKIDFTRFRFLADTPIFGILNNIHEITPPRQRSPDMTFIDRSSITGYIPLHTHLVYEFCPLL